MIAMARRAVWRMMALSLSPRARRASRESCVVTPTMKRKNGKIRSVGVQPNHGACSSGSEIDVQLPGLFTRSMPATVIPRNTSSDRSRSCAGDLATAAPSEVDLEMTEEEEQSDDRECRECARPDEQRPEELCD